MASVVFLRCGGGFFMLEEITSEHCNNVTVPKSSNVATNWAVQSRSGLRTVPPPKYTSHQQSANHIIVSFIAHRLLQFDSGIFWPLLKKRLEAFEMWILRGKKRVKWTNRVRDEAVLKRVGEKRIMLKLIRKRKRKLSAEGCTGRNVNGRRVRGRRRYQMIGDIKIYESYEETKRKADNRKDWLMLGLQVIVILPQGKSCIRIATSKSSFPSEVFPKEGTSLARETSHYASVSASIHAGETTSKKEISTCVLQHTSWECALSRLGGEKTGTRTRIGGRSRRDEDG
ncbi:hypothetical protein ANN_12689 [Periplaneta americana]|uniref:Uncharacterized protein n=1 Tax=Periplaneta americana TaxID=6978 RepID=A0ABQ8TIA1_PERAM|nr:hypothetical protein ANN_12689 [Periplaneta americana]